MRNYDLTPLMRSSVGFDRLNDLFETAFSAPERAVAYPPYNIEKTGENAYRIVMAVAGFKEGELEIVTQNNELVVRGRVQETETAPEEVTYLHKGIANRSFEHKFRLADHVVVKGANLEHGLLTLALEQEIPESAKPRVIPVNGTKTIEGKKK